MEDVAVFPFTFTALRRLQLSGFATVVVTNQSAVGRGLLTEQGLADVHEEIFRQLGDRSCIDGIYYCTSMPVSGDPRIVEDPDRKPGPGMLLRAARDLNLDIAASWIVGDAISDMLAGRNAGCRGTILVRTGYGHRLTEPDSAIDYVTNDIQSAADLILSLSEPSPIN